MDASQYARQDGLGYAIHGGTTHEKVGLLNAPPSQSDSYGTSAYTRSQGITEPSQGSQSQLHLMAPTRDPHNQEPAYGAYCMEAPPQYGDIRT
jgi:hypothetical protein